MTGNAFIGTWRLVSATSRTATGEVTSAFAAGTTGYLMYNEDGFMAVSIMEPRTNFASADMDAGSPSEMQAAFETYFSYLGTYTVQGDKVIHHIRLSLFPNWSGGDQQRFFEFSGDRLTLRTPPMLLQGVEQTTQLVWQRIDGNPSDS
jgi:hypothetical protein